MLDISPPPGSSVTTFEGGGAGPSGSGGQGGGPGPGGKWHEGSNTPGPSRRGTGASMDNSDVSPVAGPSAGSSQMTRQANTFTNAEAGPSKTNSLQMASVGRHRVTSGGANGSLPAITPVSPLVTPWNRNVVNSPPNQVRQHERQRSLSHSSPVPNENVNPNWASRPSMQHHPQSHPVSQKNNGKGYLTENMSSAPSTPYSSLPPSPSSPVFPSTVHHRQSHTRSASVDQAQPKSSPTHPRSPTIPNHASPLSTFHAPNQSSSNAPIHARFSHTQSHPYDSLISGSLPPIPSSPLGSGSSDVDEFMVIPSSGEEVSGVGGGWKLVSKGYAVAPTGGPTQAHAGGTGFMVLGKKDKGAATLKMIRRRTAIDPSGMHYRQITKDMLIKLLSQNSARKAAMPHAGRRMCLRAKVQL